MPSVLVIEDNRTMREGLVITLTKMGLEASGLSDGESALRLLAEKKIDLVVSDFKMPGMNGLEVLEKLKASRPELDVILITAYGSVDLAVEAMRLGAADFLTKDFSPEHLRVRVEKVLAARAEKLEKQRLAEENALLRSEAAEAAGFSSLVGESPAMKDVFEKISLVAQSDSSVLITGESGTGKELVAREIHSKSTRAGGPFVRVSCGALAESVLESELFGHEKGAFTGSVKSRRGRFELAHGGTIFLDEVGDVSPTVQVKLLRVLQEREFERLGGEKTISVDVRVLSATNKNLVDQVSQGNFREDLFYRLHVVPIHLPSLRERPGDIPLLAGHLVAKICRKMNRPPAEIEPPALEILCGYNWPGNVRELENVLERALVLGPGDRLSTSDIPPLVEREYNLSLPAGDNIDLNRTLEQIENRIIQHTLARCAGNKSRTARMLGLKTSVLYYKLEKYGIS
ncbi:MAG: sigma-54-dependent Fis family transcriptional regulator [Candidatus Glassbacteria bacterium]|nr:sigma-54-dependent Fis family transcriptional regulator [Candidatus Glassbacteria bacterium]